MIDISQSEVFYPSSPLILSVLEKGTIDSIASNSVSHKAIVSVHFSVKFSFYLQNPFFISYLWHS